MSHMLTPDVGVMPPLQDPSKVTGATIVPVLPHASVDLVEGDVIALNPSGSAATTYSAFNPFDCEVFTALTPANDTATEQGAWQQARTHAIMLTSLNSASNGGELGYACVRGLCMANVAPTSTTISKNHGLFIPGGSVTLDHIEDAGNGSRVRIVAISRYTGTVAGAATAKIPVFFDGVNGMIGTVAAPVAVTALTDNSGGTANGTLEVIGASYSQSEIANNFADVAAKINGIITALGLGS